MQKKILSSGCKELHKIKDLKKIVGVVSSNNIPSLKTFTSLEFNRLNEKDGYITFEKILK